MFAYSLPGPKLPGLASRDLKEPKALLEELAA
jgi:hypothetical protein